VLRLQLRQQVLQQVRLQRTQKAAAAAVVWSVNISNNIYSRLTHMKLHARGRRKCVLADHQQLQRLLPDLHHGTPPFTAQLFTTCT
jgi:hypothetical protein